MIAELFFLAASLSGSALPAQELVDLAADVRSVALEEPALFAGDDARARTARLLLVWTIRESAGRASALGDCDDPVHRTVATCRSFGAMQMRAMWLGDVRVEDLLADRRLALRLGLALMRDLAGKCGSVRAGLRAYAGGSCIGSLRARDIVSTRCNLAGGY